MVDGQEGQEAVGVPRLLVGARVLGQHVEEGLLLVVGESDVAELEGYLESMIWEAQVWIWALTMNPLWAEHCFQAMAALLKKTYSFRFRLRAPSWRVIWVRLVRVSMISCR